FVCFFSDSACSWEILTRHVNYLTVKPLSQTRWESRIDALTPLLYELGNIYDALIEISDDTTFTGSSGNTARSDAEALANGLFKFKFVTSLICGIISFSRLTSLVSSFRKRT
ncbi:hypothetical protein G0U57_019064, partial [Chelydra serpentina]